MTTTRAIYQQRQHQRTEWSRARQVELLLLVLSSVTVACALALVYLAKTRAFEEYTRDLAQGRLLVLRQPLQAPALAAHLRSLGMRGDVEFTADQVVKLLRKEERLRNVGALGRLRVDEQQVRAVRGLEEFPRRIARARTQRELREQIRLRQMSTVERWFESVSRRIFPRTEEPVDVAVFNRETLAAIKPSLIVRTPEEFTRAFVISVLLCFLAVYAVHLFWRLRRFGGDPILFPLIHLLSGIGLALMVSLRDPLRDSMSFAIFAQGIALGCAATAAASVIRWERTASRYTYLWLLASVATAIALALFGSGPGSSDARVNLLGFQPVEAMRIFLVLFLAGYFASTWDALRELRQRQGTFASIARLLHLARLDYTLPVLAGAAIALLLFFLLRDMGPALVIGGVFLCLYSVARNSFRLAAFGLAVLLAGFWFAHLLAFPRTVHDRVEIWLSVWDNGVRGGEQVAHALWSLAAGSVFGTGLGLGSPSLVPEGATDLVLAVVGEELGFAGLVAVLLLYAVLVNRCCRIAFRASSTYGFFLVLGLALVTALQLLLIAAGALGMLPLTGVVSPFLSFGRSSMVANFAVVGIVLSVSNGKQGDHTRPFAQPVRWIGGVLAAGIIIVIGAAGWHQVVRADETLVRGALAVDGDGVRRYAYNPRLTHVARQIPRGDILDRNGVPLATSSWDTITRYRETYAKMGIPIDQYVSRFERRYYPFGPPFFYLLGDIRTMLKQGAPNTTLEERDSRTRLQGYDDAVEVEDAIDPATGRRETRLKYDYRELVPLLRHRHEPEHDEVQALLKRPRDLRMSVDARFQWKASQILASHLHRLKLQKGAVVVLDAATGDLLAAVSHPWPALSQLSTLRLTGEPPVPDKDLVDRVRYGLYPPGSAFKVVTAIAALNRDPFLAEERFECRRLPDGRVGNYVKGFGRPVRDDVQDRHPHGKVDLAHALTVSCNAYFAQLATLRLKAVPLKTTADRFGIKTAEPDTASQLARSLPQAAYGQGQVVASPFQMARVAATIASGGVMPYGRWIVDETNRRAREPERILSKEAASRVAAAMRSVVTSGTGRRAALESVPIAGKTGTAELANQASHAWFIGFAPYNGPGRKIAFAIIVENGRYGGSSAAPIASDLVRAARETGLLGK